MKRKCESDGGRTGQTAVAETDPPTGDATTDAGASTNGREGAKRPCTESPANYTGTVSRLLCALADDDVPALVRALDEGRMSASDWFTVHGAVCDAGTMEARTAVVRWMGHATDAGPQSGLGALHALEYGFGTAADACVLYGAPRCLEFLLDTGLPLDDARTDILLTATLAWQAWRRRTVHTGTCLWVPERQRLEVEGDHAERPPYDPEPVARVLLAHRARVRAAAPKGGKRALASLSRTTGGTALHPIIALLVGACRRWREVDAYDTVNPNGDRSDGLKETTEGAQGIPQSVARIARMIREAGYDLDATHGRGFDPSCLFYFTDGNAPTPPVVRQAADRFSGCAVRDFLLLVGGRASAPVRAILDALPQGS
jgi:hypothetical protein